MTIDLTTLCSWSAPREVTTARGKRLLRTAEPTEAFSAAWKSDKAALQAAGLGWSKDRNGAWQVCWWQDATTPEEAAKQNAAVAASKATDAAVEIPAPEGLAYMPFQKAGIAFMAERSGVLLADDMGLGKTVQAIGVINLDTSVKNVLVVCPASLKVNWRNELTKWLVRPLVVGIQNAGEAWIGNLADVVILNYDILTKFPQIYNREWDVLIVDEAHFVKNRNAKRTKLLLGCKRRASAGKPAEELPGVRARRRIFATGTPILNNPVEIFPLLQSLEPGKWTFRDMCRYCNGHQGRFGWDFSGAAYLDELQIRLRSSVMVRRLKRDVLNDLPPKRRQVIEVAANGASGLVDEERETWDRHEDGLAELQAQVETAELADDEAAYKAAVQELRKAQQVAFTEVSLVRHQVALAKVDKVVEHVVNVLEDTQKVVLFVHHLDVAQSYAAALAEYNPQVITGETTIGLRQDIVDQFNSTPEQRVLILGIHAAGVGLSVKASVEVFAELDWVPGIISQAEDRCYGVGRGIEGEPLLVQHLVLEGSLDAKMAKTIVRKQDVADRALDKGAMAVVGREPVLIVTVGSVLEQKDGKAQVRAASAELRQTVHAGLRRLASVCDGAASEDGHGFNKFDTAFGKSLAARPFLTDKMVWAGVRLCVKYSGQLGGDFKARVQALAAVQ